MPNAPAKPGPGPEDPTDTQLLEAWRAGESAALDQLIRRYQRPVYRLLYRNLGNAADAEDFTQAAFLKVLDRLPGLRDDGAFRGWLFRIALNLCRNHRRHLLRWREVGPAPLERQASREENLDTQLDARRRWQSVERGLARLPRLQREVVRLRLHAELPFKEIAQVLGSSEASCKVSYHHAVKKLRISLQERPS